MKTTIEWENDLKTIRNGMLAMTKFDTITFSKEVLSEMKELEKQCMFNIKKSKNREYLEAIKFNFRKGNFKVKEDKIKLILEDKNLFDFILEEYEKEAQKVSNLFGVDIKTKPTKDNLKKFLQNWEK